MVHVIGTNEAYNRYEWIMSHRNASWNIEKKSWNIEKMTHFYLPEFCKQNALFRLHLFAGVLAHIWMRRVTRHKE